MVKMYWAIVVFALMTVPALPTVLRAGQSPPESIPHPVAQVKERIEMDRFEVRVYQGKKLVQLPRFMELYVVTPLPGSPNPIENLAKKSVAIFRSEKNPERWEVYQDVWAGTGGDALTLADNVFKVKQVLISSPQSPIELRLDEKVVQLKPGDVLLVL
jgi:hypothetical protein